ncbi:4-hydroxybenzoate polyprenyltransferase [Pseudomonas sp. SJZ101]|nr:4-hydroxybenzoate polyprenyltransferase [Pseudomonas sp. SJZ075]TWC35831.1 4-hydroxybenzoate polyprenyltransferase [Pseudomonas sp. SJZ078]TWC56699.1 4-hydroxybenzoate polyprenyltransferase [Pseudomonas sp. SJZ124]TWC91908.1 4-hydroxybenzoate polyprenyltransferase [Pseudomonas sp. SJZ101]
MNACDQVLQPMTEDRSVSLPFVVDLDGTLLKSDLMFECAMAFVRNQTWRCLKVLAWVLRGKAYLKKQLAQSTDVDVSLLPYDQDVLTLIDEQRRLGRKIVLATASYHSLAQRIGEHLQVFDEILATRLECNLSGPRKRDRLIELFGQRGFDYVGNALDDLVIWRSARLAYVVNPSAPVELAILKLGNVVRLIRSDTTGFSEWRKALRLHQWAKNALIFVPLLAAHQITNPMLLWHGLLAFILFGLCASGVYILNDLLDLEDDRRHPTKRNRPFASGCLSIRSGLTICPVLLIISLGGAWWWLPPRFVSVLAFYYALTLVYSFKLKHIMPLDVITLALLYTLRIIAGGAAFDLELTPWILAFSMFIFLSLALVKRYTELLVVSRNGVSGKASGRDYYPGDMAMLSSLGAASGYLAVLVLALYIRDSATVALYERSHIIWLACPLLLFWITRLWMLTHRGLMKEDPVVFALKDRLSLVVGVLFCLIFWSAT